MTQQRTQHWKALNRGSTPGEGLMLPPLPLQAPTWASEQGSLRPLSWVAVLGCLLSTHDCLHDQDCAQDRIRQENHQKHLLPEPAGRAAESSCKNQVRTDLHLCYRLYSYLLDVSTNSGGYMTGEHCPHSQAGFAFSSHTRSSIILHVCFQLLRAVSVGLRGPASAHLGSNPSLTTY